MALTKQQKNTRAQKQSKKANTKTKTRYQQMIADRKAQSGRSSIDEVAFNTAAMNALEGLEGMDCPSHKTGVALVVRGEGYSGAGTLSCLYNDETFVQEAVSDGKTDEQVFASMMELVDLGEMQFRDFTDIDTEMPEQTATLTHALDNTSPEVRLLKAVSLFANITHNASDKNKSMDGTISKVRVVAMAAIHRLIRKIDPSACKVAIALTSMPASPGVLKSMSDVLKAHELVFMDVHNETDSIIIQNNANETVAVVSLHCWRYKNVPLLMVAGGPKSEVPAGATVH